MKKNLATSLSHVMDHAQGKTAGGRTTLVEPTEIDVLSIRKELGYSQTEFAMRFGFSLATLKNWEQGRRQPEGPARVLLTVIEYRPDIVNEALNNH